MKFKLYFDGNKTPQGVTCTYVVVDHQNNRILENTEVLANDLTVPEAEYYGLLKGLEKFIIHLKNNEINPKNVGLEVYGDSQLVLRQLTGEYECKKPNLRILRSKVRDMVSVLGEVSFIWIERTKNLAR